MTKNRTLPDFLKKTDEGWRVDTDAPGWEILLSGKRRQPAAASIAKKLGARLARSRKTKSEEKSGGTACASEAAGGDEPGDVEKAAADKIIYNSKREKLKMEQDEIKTGKMRGAFIERAEGEYWLSFMQRGITDSFSTINRCFMETKRLILAGNDTEAKQYMRDELKAGFERVVRDMEEAVRGAAND
jgi:hypothetical protein